MTRQLTVKDDRKLTGGNDQQDRDLDRVHSEEQRNEGTKKE
jgi:hypothetical protein